MTEHLPLTRPRWLLPGIIGAVIVAGLVLAGVVPLSTVIYAGMFGGMVWMHVSGHGHGGHGGGHQADLSGGSSTSQPVGAASGSGLDQRAPENHDNETAPDDQHHSHTCSRAR